MQPSHMVLLARQRLAGCCLHYGDLCYGGHAYVALGAAAADVAAAAAVVVAVAAARLHPWTASAAVAAAAAASCAVAVGVAAVHAGQAQPLPFLLVSLLSLLLLLLLLLKVTGQQPVTPGCRCHVKSAANCQGQAAPTAHKQPLCGCPCHC